MGRQNSDTIETVVRFYLGGPVKLFTTIAVGPDGKEYDLAVKGFPKRDDYIPVNAFTREVYGDYSSIGRT